MEFIKGADISFLPQYEAEGRKFYNMDNRQLDAFALAKEYGINWIRLRIWNEPERIPEAEGWCSLAHTLRMAERARSAGMKLMLDFHYSDYWADPANQKKPLAWEGLDAVGLEKAVYDYTRSVLEAFGDKDVFPDMVQIGNEIRSGMLFPEGKAGNWDNLAGFVNAGLKAVRDSDTQKKCRTAIHLDQGGRYYFLEGWFDAMISHGVHDFDVIALSYYPFWHGDFSEFQKTLDKMCDKYNRPIVIAEAAHGWRKTENGFVGEAQERIAGIPLTESGQRKALELIMNITANLKEYKGLGVFYWEPFSFPGKDGGGWGSNMGVLEEGGRAHEGILAFRFQPGMQEQQGIARLYDREPVYLPLGSEVTLPEEIRGLTWQGKIKEYPVKWRLPSQWEWEEGCREIEGIVTEQLSGSIVSHSVRIQVVTYGQGTEDMNLLPNGSFSQGLEGWCIEKDVEEVGVEIREELTRPFPEPPEPVCLIASGTNFKMKLFRKSRGLPTGSYQLSIQCLGANTTGVRVSLYLKVGDKSTTQEVFLQNDYFMTYETTELYIGGEEVEVEAGIYVDSPPIEIKLKDFRLKQTNH